MTDVVINGRITPSKWVSDIHEMHAKFGVHEWAADPANKDKLYDLLKFRIDVMVREEFEETVAALEAGDGEEVVDGLIDLCVFAIGTLDIFGVSADRAWDQIYNANMSKEPGIKPGRPNPWGLPDMVKPEDWVGPSHEDNHGRLDEVLKNGR